MINVTNLNIYPRVVRRKDLVFFKIHPCRRANQNLVYIKREALQHFSYSS